MTHDGNAPPRHRPQWRDLHVLARVVAVVAVAFVVAALLGALLLTARGAWALFWALWRLIPA